jgi:glutathione S-transferase
LDGVLANKKYLVGEKVTIADFSFVPWDFALPFLLNGFELSLEEVGKNTRTLPDGKKAFANSRLLRRRSSARVR